MDGGPDPSVTLGQLGRHMPFWDHTIDMVVLSSSDGDHLAGLVSVVERYQVGRVLQGEFAEETATYRQWQEVLQVKGVPVTTAERGQRMVLGRGALLEVLHPGPEPMTGTGSDDNNNSVVLRLRWGRTCFLLTGDIEEEAERLLTSTFPDLSCAVLKVGHHGSKTNGGRWRSRRMGRRTGYGWGGRCAVARTQGRHAHCQSFLSIHCATRDGVPIGPTHLTGSKRSCRQSHC